MPDKYQRLRPYLDLVLQPDPFFMGNGSHWALSALTLKFGRLPVSEQLDDYFTEFGPDGTDDPYNKHGDKYNG